MNFSHRCISLAFLLAIVLVAVAVADDSTDERFLEGLQQRRLFKLAERYCESRLQDPAIPPADQGLFVRELIRTYALHASNSRADDRIQWWQQMNLTAQRFLQDNPDSSDRLVIRLQQALGVLARGELERLEAEVAADPSSALEQAREAIREAIRTLESLDGEITELLPQRRRSADPKQLSAEELVSLQNHVRLERARAARNQALSYPSGSPDRLAALSQGAELLSVPLREVPVTEAFGAQVRLEAATIQRLLGDHAAAAAVLAELSASRIPAEFVWLARAEKVRLELDSGQTQQALQSLTAIANVAGQATAEFDFAALEVLLALWRTTADANQQPEAEKWRDRALDAVKRIEREHGPFWGRRAEILLVRTGMGRSGGNSEILERAADDLFLKGKRDEAQATYEKAASAALAASETAAAFKLAYKAALIDHQQSRYAAAAERFRRLALSLKQHPQAAPAHLLAVINCGQLVKSDPSERPAYVQLLEEHVAQWPTADTANAANLWLGGIREQDQNWQQALDAYYSVKLDSKYAKDAISGLDRCWPRRFQELAARGDDVSSAASQAAAWMEQSFVTNGNLPASWTPLQYAAVIAAARLRLAWTSGPTESVERSLDAALRGQPPPAAETAATLKLLWILALGRQPSRLAEAKQAVAGISGGSATELLWLVRQLANANAPAAPPSVQRELGQLQLAVLDRMATVSAPPSPELRREIARARSQSLQRSGDIASALRELVQLARAQPHDGSIQEELAAMYLASPDSQDWQRGLDQWRIVASKSEPRSPRWFRAKYFVALAQKRLGDADSARKLIQYLQATENLSQSGLEREFLQLLKESENAKSDQAR